MGYLYDPQKNFHLNFQQAERGTLACANPLNEALQITRDIIRQGLEEGQTVN